MIPSEWRKLPTEDQEETYEIYEEDMIMKSWTDHLQAKEIKKQQRKRK